MSFMNIKGADKSAYVYNLIKNIVTEVFECKVTNIFLSINFNIALGAQTYHLIETVLLSTIRYVLVEK